MTSKTRTQRGHHHSSRIVVKAIAGRNLLSKDRGGTSDPYLKIRLGKKEYKTHVVRKTLDPVWDEEFDLHQWPEYEKLYITCWDKDYGTSDQFLGEVYIPKPNNVRGRTRKEHKLVSNFKLAKWEVSGTLEIEIRDEEVENRYQRLQNRSQIAQTPRKGTEATSMTGPFFSSGDRSGSQDWVVSDHKDNLLPPHPAIHNPNITSSAVVPKLEAVTLALASLSRTVDRSLWFDLPIAIRSDLSLVRSKVEHLSKELTEFEKVSENDVDALTGFNKLKWRFNNSTTESFRNMLIDDMKRNHKITKTYSDDAWYFPEYFSSISANLLPKHIALARILAKRKANSPQLIDSTARPNCWLAARIRCLVLPLATESTRENPLGDASKKAENDQLEKKDQLQESPSRREPRSCSSRSRIPHSSSFSTISMLTSKSSKERRPSIFKRGVSVQARGSGQDSPGHLRKRSFHKFSHIGKGDLSQGTSDQEQSNFLQPTISSEAEGSNGRLRAVTESGAFHGKKVRKKAQLMRKLRNVPRVRHADMPTKAVTEAEVMRIIREANKRDDLSGKQIEDCERAFLWTHIRPEDTPQKLISRVFTLLGEEGAFEQYCKNGEPELLLKRLGYHSYMSGTEHRMNAYEYIFDCLRNGNVPVLKIVQRVRPQRPKGDVSITSPYFNRAVGGDHFPPDPTLAPASAEVTPRGSLHHSRTASPSLMAQSAAHTGTQTPSLVMPSFSLLPSPGEVSMPCSTAVSRQPSALEPLTIRRAADIPSSPDTNEPPDTPPPPQEAFHSTILDAEVASPPSFRLPSPQRPPPVKPVDEDHFPPPPSPRSSTPPPPPPPPPQSTEASMKKRRKKKRKKKTERVSGSSNQKAGTKQETERQFEVVEGTMSQSLARKVPPPKDSQQAFEETGTNIAFHNRRNSPKKKMMHSVSEGVMIHSPHVSPQKNVQSRSQNHLTSPTGEKNTNLDVNNSLSKAKPIRQLFSSFRKKTGTSEKKEAASVLKLDPGAFANESSRGELTAAAFGTTRKSHAAALSSSSFMTQEDPVNLVIHGPGEDSVGVKEKTEGRQGQAQGQKGLTHADLGLFSNSLLTSPTRGSVSIHKTPVSSAALHRELSVGDTLPPSPQEKAPRAGDVLQDDDAPLPVVTKSGKRAWLERFQASPAPNKRPPPNAATEEAQHAPDYQAYRKGTAAMLAELEEHDEDEGPPPPLPPPPPPPGPPTPPGDNSRSSSGSGNRARARRTHHASPAASAVRFLEKPQPPPVEEGSDSEDIPFDFHPRPPMTPPPEDIVATTPDSLVGSARRLEEAPSLEDPSSSAVKFLASAVHNDRNEKSMTSLLSPPSPSSPQTGRGKSKDDIKFARRQMRTRSKSFWGGQDFSSRFPFLTVGDRKEKAEESSGQPKKDHATEDLLKQWFGPSKLDDDEWWNAFQTKTNESEIDVTKVLMEGQSFATDILISQSLQLQILGIDGLSNSFLKVEEVTSQKKYQLFVQVKVIHGLTEVCTLQTLSADFSEEPRWRETLRETELSMDDLTDCRLLFLLYSHEEVVYPSDKTKRFGKKKSPQSKRHAPISTQRVTMDSKDKGADGKKKRKSGSKGTKESRPATLLAYVFLPFLDAERQIQQGYKVLPMWVLGQEPEHIKESPLPLRGCPRPNLQVGVVVPPVLHVKLPEFHVQIKESVETREMRQAYLSEQKRDLASTSENFRNPHFTTLLEKIEEWDSLYVMTAEDKRTMWETRDHWKLDPKVLPLFLQAVVWTNKERKRVALDFLEKWKEPEPSHCLFLLDMRFANSTVRAYAVKQLEKLRLDELQLYLLQLTQALKFQMHHDSELTRFLLRKATEHPLHIGHALFWHLKAELSNPHWSERFGLILEEYLVRLALRKGPTKAMNRSYVCPVAAELRKQQAVVLRLQMIADMVTARIKQKMNKQDIIKEYKQQLKVFNDSFLKPMGTFRVPYNPQLEAKMIVVEKCRYMKSKKVPLWLVFENADPDALEPITVIFKSGDDLRQDILTLQILQVMDNIWLRSDLDLQLLPYRCVATGVNDDGEGVGMIEVVMNSKTIADIQSEIGGKTGALKVDTLHSFIVDQYGRDDMSLKHALDLFQKSTAGYLVATYILGIGDRHNDNIMLTNTGRLFHIDFGHFLGNFKSKYGFKRERKPFVLTPEMGFAIGEGKRIESNKPQFKKFKDICCKAFNTLRRQQHASLLETLFILLISAGMPELMDESDVHYLGTKLCVSKKEAEATKILSRQISSSLGDNVRRVDNFIHNLKHGK